MTFAIVLAVGTVAALWWARRLDELFYVSIRDGRVLVVRGRIPQGLLNDFSAVVASRPAVAGGSIRASLTPHGARLTSRGIDEGREQRLRNVFHLYPTAQLRLARPPAQRTVGQWLGIAWLAWLFQPRQPLEP